MNSLRQDIAAVLNRYSRENGSNTPDWILAEYLILCLEAFDGATKARDKWYGAELSPGHCQLVDPDESDSPPTKKEAFLETLSESLEQARTGQVVTLSREELAAELGRPFPSLPTEGDRP